MKSIKRSQLVKGLMIILLGIMPCIVFGQDDPGGGPDVPIDGGLSLLLAAGAAYGVKKYRDNRKKQEDRI